MINNFFICVFLWHIPFGATKKEVFFLTALAYLYPMCQHVALSGTLIVQGCSWEVLFLVFQLAAVEAEEIEFQNGRNAKKYLRVNGPFVENLIDVGPAVGQFTCQPDYGDPPFIHLLPYEFTYMHSFYMPVEPLIRRVWWSVKTKSVGPVMLIPTLRLSHAQHTG